MKTVPGNRTGNFINYEMAAADDGFLNEFRALKKVPQFHGPRLIIVFRKGPIPG